MQTMIDFLRSGPVGLDALNALLLTMAVFGIFPGLINVWKATRDWKIRRDWYKKTQQTDIGKLKAYELDSRHDAGIFIAGGIYSLAIAVIYVGLFLGIRLY